MCLDNLGDGGDIDYFGSCKRNRRRLPTGKYIGQETTAQHRDYDLDWNTQSGGAGKAATASEITNCTTGTSGNKTCVTGV